MLYDTLPFWINHSVDQEFGGFMFCLDRDGTIIDTEKAMWQTGRFTWLLATLYYTVEQNLNGWRWQCTGSISFKNMDLTLMAECFFWLIARANHYGNKGMFLRKCEL